MVCCAIAGCSNHTRNQNKLSFKFHSFPKDNETRKKWVHACRRADSFSVDTARICSVHFESSAYARDLKSELLNLPPKQVLKQDAVPTLNLSASSVVLKDKSSPSNEKRTFRAQKRSSRKEVEDILQGTSNDFSFSELVSEENNMPNSDNVKHCECDIDSLNSKLETMSLEIKELREQNLQLQDRLSQTNAELLRLKQLRNVVRGTFSESQQQFLMKGRCTNWSSEDIAKAATLRCLSYKALGFLRDVLKYPLPSEVTIKRRLRQFSVPPGFIDLSINVMKTQSKVLTQFEKDVILSFDEMKVKNDLCFDQKEEIIRGPHNNVQVMVIRSLVGKWMQPIYYNFDTAVSKDLLMETIQVVENAEFKVRAFVCDMGPSNRKLMGDLKVSFEDSDFKNPSAEQRNVWVFCDVPHALKLLRNHLLDSGYRLKSGALMTKDAFVKLVELQNTGTDLNYAYKLTMNHLLVAGTERQNVRKAAELFSMTVGNAICHNLPEFSHVGEIVRDINNGFDVLNSRFPVDGNRLKSAYGNYKKEQDEALDKLYDTILTMRVIKPQKEGKKAEQSSNQKQANNESVTRNENPETIKSKKKKNEKEKNPTDGLLPFQKGFLMSINSLRSLFKDLKSEDYTYIMTSRCNQDILESYFSKVRGLGRFYDHPLPTTVSQRLKSLILSRNASDIMTYGNCNEEKGISTLSGNILSEPQETTVEQLVCEEEETSNMNDSLESECEMKEAAEIITEVDEIFESCNDVEEEVQDLKEKKELLEMIAGYVAYRVKRKLPEQAHKYGDFTKNVQVTGKNWLQAISRGYLMKPTDWFMESVLKMEKEFQTFHGDFIDNGPKVFTRLINIINAKYPGMANFAVTCYVRTRTFIRMKNLNKKRNRKGNKRAESEQRQKVKKMRKVTN